MANLLLFWGPAQGVWIQLPALNPIRIACAERGPRIWAPHSPLRPEAIKPNDAVKGNRRLIYGYEPAGPVYGYRRDYVEGYTDTYVNPDAYFAGSPPWWQSMDKRGRGGQGY